MFRSLYSKLALVLLGLFCTTGFFFIALTLFSTDMYQSEINQKLNLKLAENIVAEKLLIQDNRINRDALKEIFHMLMVINPSIELYLIDPEGTILTYSAPPDKVKLASVDLGPIRYWYSKDRVLPVMGEDPRNPGKYKAISVARIPATGDPLQGYLYVILGGETYDSILVKLKSSYILQVSVWAIIAVIFFALLAGFVVFAFLTRRLKKLAHAMDEFKDSRTIPGLQAPGRNTGALKDEIDRLDQTFVRMAEHIKDQMTEIRKSDTLRRDLIANISHDLRTPIATLQGYVETLLLKESMIAPDERKTYLETAHKHCLRLSHLVDNLFELARLDAPEMSLHVDPFNLVDLCHDVIQKFQLSANDKSISLTADIQGNTPLANADIRLIERVLENLIENAIQHTSRNGSIIVGICSQDQLINVRIEDTGLGIPPDELPHIFNRFYQVDKSRHVQSGHSGLGLAITHRILELHNQTITVGSSMGKGTVFSFHLPAIKW